MVSSTPSQKLILSIKKRFLNWIATLPPPTFLLPTPLTLYLIDTISSWQYLHHIDSPEWLDIYVIKSWVLSCYLKPESCILLEMYTKLFIYNADTCPTQLNKWCIIYCIFDLIIASSSVTKIYINNFSYDRWKVTILYLIWDSESQY